MFDEFFSTANELRSRGVPFATAIVVRAEAPSSAKPGDKAIVTLDGVMRGWIGGSCAQPTVVEEGLEAIADGRSRLVRITPDLDEQARPGIELRRMTCYSGGVLEVYIEPQRPRPSLLVVGHLPVARALAQLGRAMSFRVVVFDPQNEGSNLEHADEVVDSLERLPEFSGPTTSIVVASHGHYDETALELALRSSAPYVGLVASRKRAATIRRNLETKGLEHELLGRLRAPAGLDIAATRGDEIALSIMAEIVQHRRSGRRQDWLVPAEGEWRLDVPSDAGEPEAGGKSCCSEPHEVTHPGSRQRSDG